MLKKINKGMMKIFEAEEEDEIEPESKIKKAVEAVKNIEGFVQPEKPDLTEFDELADKSKAIQDLSSKFVENPRIIMKEVENMKTLL